MREVIVHVYKFEELGEKAKARVILNALDYFVELPYEDLSKEMKEACDEADDMRTPWFVQSYMLEYAKPEIMAEINEHEYFIDGEIFWQPELENDNKSNIS